MESESEDFEVNPVGSSFFEGLAKAPKLTMKESILRNSIHENSWQESKATSLQDKIAKIERTKNRQPAVASDNTGMFQEKVIVEQNDNPKKSRKATKNIMTL